MNKFTTCIFLLFTLCAVSGCKKDAQTPILQPADYSALIARLTDEVIVQTYRDFDTKAQFLLNTIEILQDEPTSINLEAAREAWRDTRVPFELGEAFLFGPIDFKGLDPAIDSWPLNVTDLHQILNGNVALNKIYVDGLDGSLKGFHALEYLLFGADGNQQVNEITPREFEFLQAGAESLKGDAEELYFGWHPDHENFAAQLKNAGNSGSIYPSQKAVLEELMNTFVGIAIEVAEVKIHEPFVTRDVLLEESLYSANSKSDFADNIGGIKNLYYGAYNSTNGEGISQIIAAASPGLDQKVKQQLDIAINSILDIQGTFTSALLNSEQSVLVAEVNIKALQATLVNEIIPIIQNL